MAENKFDEVAEQKRLDKVISDIIDDLDVMVDEVHQKRDNEIAFLKEMKNQLIFVKDSTDIEFFKRHDIFENIMLKFVNRYGNIDRLNRRFWIGLTKEAIKSTWNRLLIFYMIMGISIYSLKGYDDLINWLLELPFIFLGSMAIVIVVLRIVKGNPYKKL